MKIKKLSGACIHVNAVVLLETGLRYERLLINSANDIEGHGVPRSFGIMDWISLQFVNIPVINLFIF